MLKKPKSSKYTKYHKGRISYNFNFNQRFSHGDYALITEEPIRLTAAQIAAAELAIKRKIQKNGTLYTRVYPHSPVTKKPLEVRMGKGKGTTSYWMSRIRSGTFLFELTCINPELAKLAFKIASSKLPIRTTFVSKI